MDRVYVPDICQSGRVIVKGPEAHHLTRVRRAGSGSEVACFDGRGRAFRGRIESVARARVEIVIEGALPSPRRPGTVLTIASAVPKGERFDWLIEKATELGVSRFVPIRTSRSVVDPRLGKLDRLRRRVVEACKQSGRDWLMELVEPVDWSSLIAGGPDGLGLIAHPGGQPIAKVSSVDRLTVAIGPEGGLTDAEIDLAIQGGWRTIGLGPQILRIETAAIAATAAILAFSEGEIE